MTIIPKCNINNLNQQLEIKQHNTYIVKSFSWDFLLLFCEVFSFLFFPFFSIFFFFDSLNSICHLNGKMKMDASTPRLVQITNEYFVITCGHCKFGYGALSWRLDVCHGTSPCNSSANMATIKIHTKMKKTIKHE